MIDIPTVLRDALPAGTDLDRCTIMNYGAIRNRVNHPAVHPLDDAVVVILPGWQAQDGDSSDYYPDATSADDATQRFTAGADWDADPGATWSVAAWRVGYVLVNGEAEEIIIDSESHTIGGE